MASTHDVSLMSDTCPWRERFRWQSAVTMSRIYRISTLINGCRLNACLQQQQSNERIWINCECRRCNFLKKFDASHYVMLCADAVRAPCICDKVIGDRFRFSVPLHSIATIIIQCGGAWFSLYSMCIRIGILQYNLWWSANNWSPAI